MLRGGGGDWCGRSGGEVFPGLRRPFFYRYGKFHPLDRQAINIFLSFRVSIRVRVTVSEWPSRHRQRSVCCFHVCSLFAFCRSSLLEVITYAPSTTTPLHWRPRCDDLLRLFGKSKSPERPTSADSNEKRKREWERV